MKPTCPPNECLSRRQRGARSYQPRPEYFFQPNALENFGGGKGAPRPASIRSLSEDYFEREARSHFKSEVAFFVLIAATVAMPLYEMVRGLIDWVL